MTDDELYELFGQTFEWNKMKAARNVYRHGVRFTEAASVFFDPDVRFRVDEEHMDDEDRFTAVGWSVRARTLLVVHVVRDQHIRIISAREAKVSERREYEAQLGRRI